MCIYHLHKNVNATMDVWSAKHDRMTGAVIMEKAQERKLKWYGHLMRREEHYVGRRTVGMEVQGRGRKPTRRWMDRVRDDIKEKGLSGKEVYIRAARHLHH